jgi:hypothetical protein
MFLDFLSEQLLQGQDPFLPDAETPFDIWHQRTAQLQPVRVAAVADQQVWVHSMPGMRLRRGGCKAFCCHQLNTMHACQRLLSQVPHSPCCTVACVLTAGCFAKCASSSRCIQ